jgi:hypothetical protein
MILHEALRYATDAMWITVGLCVPLTYIVVLIGRKITRDLAFDRALARQRMQQPQPFGWLACAVQHERERS